MGLFTLSFLIATPFIPDADDGKPKKQKLSNAGIEATDETCVKIEAKKQTFFCHLEYDLLPDQAPECLDVVYWGNVAKVYAKNTSKSVTPYVVDGLSWIHFRVRHKLKLDDVVKFHAHYVTFTVNPDKRKLGAEAKADKVKMFYGCKTDERLFRPLRETEEDNGPRRLQEVLEATVEESEHAQTITQMIAELSKEYNDESNIRTPTNLELDELPAFKMIKQIESQKFTDVTKKAPKGKTKDGIQYQISGELFLSGRKQLTNCVKYSAEQLPFFCSVVSANGLLTRKQAERYNPFSVTLSHVKYMPSCELRGYGISKVRFQYEVCGEIGVESNDLTVGENMQLNYTRTMLTHQFEGPAFIEYMQTRGLKIEIFGIVDATPMPVKPSMYNHEPNSSFRRRSKAATPDSAVSGPAYFILGIAFFDISSLLTEPHRLLLKSNFQRPTDIVLEGCQTEGCLPPGNVNEINGFYRVNQKPNLCSVITTSGTVLTLSVRMSYPLTKLLRHIPMANNIRNRLLVILFDMELAAEIVKKIEDDSEPGITSLDYFMCNQMHLQETISKHTVTGFLIDSVDKVLLYVDGLVAGPIQQIWMCVSSIDRTRGHVLYDSSLVFTNNFQEKWHKCNGIYKICLREPYELILSNPKAYVVGNVPLSAWRGLLCLDLLCKCSSMKTTIFRNVLPDFNCLRSMDIEFGIPFKLYKQELQRY